VSQSFSTTPPSNRLRQRIIVALAGLGIVLAAAYLALVIVTRIDELFFPGQGLSVGGLGVLPGVSDDGGGGKGRINILVMGLDRRPSEGKAPTRTDTLFVLTIDRETKSAGILGIPRDLWVDIPARQGSGVFQDRVNTAYVYGETQRYPGGGPALIEKVIERNLGIPIDHYLIIDFEGFIKVIDDLGGVDVYVEQPVDDPYYSRTELPGDYYPLHFAVGMQHMDGQTALDYSRTRFDSSDLDRIHRQQQVIFAAIDKALQQNLVSPTKLVDLWGKYKDAIATDINDLQAPGFAALAAQIDPDQIVQVSLGPATYGWTAPSGADVLLADKVLVQQIVDSIFSKEEVAQEAARVEVQNGAGSDGLDTRVMAYLTGFDFPSDALVVAAPVDGTVQPLTQIIDFGQKERTVERLASLLRVAPEQVREATGQDLALRMSQDADVVVILGADAASLNFGAEAAGG
jgi:LCP family protein required for cell wall assembly